VTNQAGVQAEERVSALSLLVPAASLLLVLAVTASGAGSTTVWYVIRAAGIVAYLLLTLSVVAGLGVRNRTMPPGRSRVDLFEVHTFLSLLVLGFASFHALTLLLDSYVGFSPTQILVPFTSSYRKVSVALGTLTLYLTAVVYVSFWLKGLIGQKGWRLLHYGSFAAFAGATYHGILSGADTSAAWMIAIYLISIVLVVGFLAYRVVIETATQDRRGATATTPGQ
jgi:sulfoxide reductase heme-binding subunit YedZ